MIGAARNVSYVDERFHVSDDPDRVLAYLLGCFIDSPWVGEAAERFAPDGIGLMVPDTLLATRVEGPEDLSQLSEDRIPADLDREWWLVTRERPGGKQGPPAAVLIEGDDLRALLRDAGLT